MNSVRILLLILKDAKGLAGSLRQALDMAGPAQVQLFPEDCPWPEENSQLVLTGWFGRIRPNITLICLPRNVLQHAPAILSAVARTVPKVPVVVASEAGEPDELEPLLGLGVSDFVLAPFRADDLLPRLCRWSESAEACGDLMRDLKEKLGLRQLLGESPLLTEQVGKIPKVAPCGASVLICGETGTGKEMFARAIHHLSPRSGKPFLPVNCGAIPPELMENELFGHEPGAFTGANSSAPGLVREADGGSLLLDEIDSIPVHSQVKLLRFLQEKEYRPLGSRRTIKADVRIIAASNANFPDLLSSGRFRSDLYYRLSVVTLTLPPLRRRKEDIPLLARYFTAKYASESGKPPKEISSGAMERLLSYDWPGNVRELENIIERAVILTESDNIGAEDIPLPMPAPTGADRSFKALKAKAIEEFEQTYVRRLLESHGGNITHAARSAGKNRRAFWELIRKHQINVKIESDFRLRQ
jgi:two-component system, NtrC family, response regulator GlrR